MWDRDVLLDLLVTDEHTCHPRDDAQNYLIDARCTGTNASAYQVYLDLGQLNATSTLSTRWTVVSP